jgi:hypothetical protein
MAAPHPREPDWEDLLRQAAEEVVRLNPRLADPPPSYTEEECAAILQDAAELEALWNSPEGQRAQQLGYSAAQAIDEDRGE